MRDGRTMRRGRWSLMVALVVASISGSVTGPVAAANDTLAGVAPVVTPFSPNGDRYRDTSGVRFTLRRDASVTVTVRDLDGRSMRTLATDRALAAGSHRVDWDGRDASGRRLPNAYYRLHVRAVNSAGTVAAEAGVTVADLAIYSRAPGLISIAVDPGHGGPDPGAIYEGIRESDLNLDISRRLTAMLRGAGVRVLQTRVTDVGFNPDRRDRTGDGRVDRADDLQGRLDIVNPVRPDLLVIVMNNASGCHCYGGPGVWLNRNRPFGTENERLGRLLQQEFVRILRRYETSTWKVRDTGLHDHPTHHEMAAYDAASRPRPGLMPTAMGESLYLDQPPELELLRRPGVRQAIADAYFEAIARYLAARPTAVAYRLLSPPPPTLAPGATGSLRVEIGNRGQQSLDGATVRVGVRRAWGQYDGSGQPGTIIGSAALPATAAGTRRAVDIAFRAPAAGRWQLIVEVVLADGRRTTVLGSPPLQVPLQVAEPAASSTPSASPSTSPSAPASGSPSSAPSSSPSP